MLNRIERLYFKKVFDPMSQLIKLEKRFESAFEKLELAFSRNKSIKIPDDPKEKKEITKESDNNIDDLLVKIAQLEKATKNDADEIDKLVEKLKEIFEIEDD